MNIKEVDEYMSDAFREHYISCCLQDPEGDGYWSDDNTTYWLYDDKKNLDYLWCYSVEDLNKYRDTKIARKFEIVIRCMLEPKI